MVANLIDGLIPCLLVLPLLLGLLDLAVSLVVYFVRSVVRISSHGLTTLRSIAREPSRAGRRLRTRLLAQNRQLFRKLRSIVTPGRILFIAALLVYLVSQVQIIETFSSYVVFWNYWLLAIAIGVRAIFLDHQSISEKIEVTKQRSDKQIDALLQWTGLVLPLKVEVEQLGDLRERLKDMEESGASYWALQARTLTAIFWAFAYTVRDFAKPGVIAAIVWKFLR